MKVEKYFDAILAITTIILFCLICQHGLYLAGGDSMHYYEIAEWSKRGEAVFQYPKSIPIQEPTHYTPGTALLTGFLAYIFKAEILDTYTYLNGFFLLANVLLFRYLAKRILNNNLLSFLAALLFLFDYGTFACHIELSSEPLFMFCFFSYLHCWLNYKEKNRTIDLILLAIFSGCATVTRYIGVVLLVPVLSTLFFKQKKYFKEPLIYLSIYMIFPILLFFRNIIFFGKTTDRVWTMHLLPFRKILQFGQTLVGWFSPLIYTKEFRFVGLILGGLSCIFFIKIIFHTIQNGSIKKLIFWEKEIDKCESKSKNYSVRLFNSITNLDFFTVFILSYLSFLIISISFLDVFTDLTSRILYPIYPFFILVVINLLRFPFVKVFDKKVFLTVVIMSYLSQSFLFVKTTFANGVEGSLTSPMNKKDPTLNFLRTNFNHLKIYSNMADVLKMNGLDNVAYTPYIYDPPSRLANSKLKSQTESILLEYEQKKAIFVFSNSGFRDFFLDYSELKDMIQEKPDTLSDKILIVVKK